MPQTGRDITLTDVQDLLGRAMVDADFRTQLLKDPEGTFVILGIKMSDASMNFFKALNDESFLQAADKVDQRLGGRPIIAVWL